MPENMLSVPKLQIATSYDSDDDFVPSITRHSRSASAVSGTSLLSLPTTPGGMSSASTITFDNTEEALHPDPGTEKDFVIEENSFAYSPGQLNKLLSPKSVQAFIALGGLPGIEYGLRTDIDAGLSIDENELEGYVSFEEAIGYRKKARDFKHRSNTAAGLSFVDRMRVYKDNVIPRKQALNKQTGPGQRGVWGTINGRKQLAFCDSGAGQNIVSAHYAKEMGLQMEHDPMLLRMGNSKYIHSPGTVSFRWSFPDDPHNITTIVARVLVDFMYPLVLGNSFIKSARLLMKENLHRFVRGVFPSSNIWRMNLLGESAHRVQGSLGNNIFVDALPDTGSSRNIIDEAYATMIGFTIRTGPKHCGHIMFPDNTTRATIGQVHTTITLPGGEFQPIVFEVLPDCYVPVVLGEDFVFDNNLFMNHGDAIFEFEGVDSTHDLLPMYYHSKAFAKVKERAKIFLSPNQTLLQTPAGPPLNYGEEIRRQAAWDQIHDDGRGASETEWRQEDSRRADHEKRRDPTWVPSDRDLIAHRPSAHLVPDDSFQNQSHSSGPSIHLDTDAISQSPSHSSESQMTGNTAVGQSTDNSQDAGSDHQADNSLHAGSGQYDIPPDTNSEDIHASSESFYSTHQYPSSSEDFRAEEGDVWSS